jgi:hypothetical protein
LPSARLYAQHKLYLRPEKCELEQTRIEYLSVIISHNKVEMDPVKIAGVLADAFKQKGGAIIRRLRQLLPTLHPWVLPPCTHTIDLTMKDIMFIWGLPQEDSFMKLKELVTSAPVLVLPNDNLPFRLEAKGSGIATGAVLLQQQANDNAWHPIAFLSKALNLVE